MGPVDLFSGVSLRYNEASGKSGNPSDAMTPNPVSPNPAYRVTLISAYGQLVGAVVAVQTLSLLVATFVIGIVTLTTLGSGRYIDFQIDPGQPAKGIMTVLNLELWPSAHITRGLIIVGFIGMWLLAVGFSVGACLGALAMARTGDEAVAQWLSTQAIRSTWVAIGMLLAAGLSFGAAFHADGSTAIGIFLSLLLTFGLCLIILPVAGPWLVSRSLASTNAWQAAQDEREVLVDLALRSSADIADLVRHLVGLIEKIGMEQTLVSRERTELFTQNPQSDAANSHRLIPRLIEAARMVVGRSSGTR
jgi:hypothetical protein